MIDRIEDYFKQAVRLQALTHAGIYLCHNCSDPIDDDDKTFCSMCREMGCSMPSPQREPGA